MEEHEGTYDMFFGIERVLRKEGKEEKATMEGFAADAARIVQTVRIASTRQVESLWRLKMVLGLLSTRKEEPSGLFLETNKESQRHG